MEFIEHVSVLDNDESSPVHYFNNHVTRGNYVVLKDDVLAAFAHAELLLMSYSTDPFFVASAKEKALKDRRDHDKISENDLAELQAMLNALRPAMDDVLTMRAPFIFSHIFWYC